VDAADIAVEGGLDAPSLLPASHPNPNKALPANTPINPNCRNMPPVIFISIPPEYLIPKIRTIVMIPLSSSYPATQKAANG
jgi:hypothetical protein